MSEIEVGSVWVSKLDSDRLVTVSRKMPENNALQYARGAWRTTLSISDFISEFEFVKNPCLDDSQNIAASILQDALAAMSERGQSYDTTGDGKERSMAKVVEMFNTLTGANLTTEQGWDFMILLKLVRASQGYKADNYVDGAAYFSLAGESASE